MQDATQDQPALVQVMYEGRFGLLAFFSNGWVAKAKNIPHGDNPHGKRTWIFCENIYDEAMCNDLMPGGAVK